MWADDLKLVAQLVAKFGSTPPMQPVIDVGGLERPTIAAYEKTIEAMKDLRQAESYGSAPSPENIRSAQMCRYLDIERPLSFLGPYIIENPEVPGGLPLERLSEKYNHAKGAGIGTAILLSVLEHVVDPFHGIDCLWQAMAPGGLAIVSVPFMFPHHPQGGMGEDNFRFTPTGLRHVFGHHPDEPTQWEVLEADWRLRIDAGQGVLDIHTGKPQAIESCYIAARAVK